MKHLFKELFLGLPLGTVEARLVYQETPHNEPPPVEVTKKGPLGVDPNDTGKLLPSGPLKGLRESNRPVYKVEKPFVVDVTDINKKVAEERAALKEAESAIAKALDKMKKAIGTPGQTAKELLANVPTDEQRAEAFQGIGGAGVPGEPEKPMVAEIPLPIPPTTPPPTVALNEKSQG